jgi:signal peptide peptidase SppA
MRRGRYQPRMTPLAVKADIFEMFFDAPESETEFELAGDVAIVEISGPLCQRPGWFWDSYEQIEARVNAALASPAKALVLRINSPGGDALGCFECSRAIRDAAAVASKPVYAFADGTAASAAYALACSASQILVPPSGFVGSIGVLQPLIDVTAQDAMYGVKYSILASGARKADGNPHQALTKEAQEEIQSRIDSIAGLFFGLVAEFRPSVTAEHVRGLEGRMFHGDSAVSVGLADGVKTWSETLAMAAGGELVTAKAANEGAGMDTEKKAAAIKSIREAYGDDKDGAEKAIKSAFPDEDKDKKGDDDKKKDDEAKSKASEDEKKKDEAKAEDEKKDDEAKAKALAAKAVGGDIAAVTAIALKAQADNAALRAELAAKDESHARAQLLATRTDFTADQLELLAVVPLAEVKKAVEKWPRGPMRVHPPAVLSAQGTPGRNNTDREPAAQVPAHEASFIAKKMGGGLDVGTGVKRSNGGRSVEMGMTTQAQARAFLEASEKEEAERAKAQKEQVG